MYIYLYMLYMLYMLFMLYIHNVYAYICALAGRKTTLGDVHPSALDSLEALGEVYSAQTDTLAEAEACFRELYRGEGISTFDILAEYV